jgi:hypothetical protein
MKSLLLLSLVTAIPTVSTLGQSSPEVRGVLIQGFADVGQLKLLAEQGDLSAQIKLADTLLSNFNSAEALKWYKIAADKNSSEAQSQAGEILLFGRVGIPKEQLVAAKPEEGLRLTYEAAISGNKRAWRNMAKALQKGTGCSIDITFAYAWLTLLADAGDIVGQVEMNKLAISLTSDDIIRGKSIAAKMKIGDWPKIPAVRVAATFKVSGITISPTKKLAIINNRTLQEGESAQIKEANKLIKFTCQKIQAGTVTILVEGEDQPRTLKSALR